MKRTSVTLLGIVLFTVAAFAQMGPPKPGPELKKLDYFLGTWTSDGDMKPGPMGPGGKFTSSGHGEWMDGGFFLVVHSDFKSGMGNSTGTAYMGYSSDDKVYTYDEFNSMGENIHSKGTVDGDTWSWSNDMKMGPQTMKAHYTMKALSPTSYTFKFEVSADGTKWDTVMDGKATKSK
jgi:Protein of unknown function (DUF1579)